METKILKYWKTIPPLFSLTACMDPRVKVEGVETSLNYIACCMNQPREPEDHIYEQLNNLYKYYQNKYDSASSNVTTSSTFGNDHFFKQLAKGKRQIGPSSKSDLSKYLDTDYCSYLSLNEIKYFDILKWWKYHESTFPVLSKMTRDLLTPSVSTVASEFIFSIATNILGERKTRLSNEILEVLICLKDWEDARFRLQKEEDEYEKMLEKLDKMDLNSKQIDFKIDADN